MTSPRHQLEHTRRRVHALLGILADLEKQPTASPAIVAVTERGLREASRELCDIVFAVLESTAIESGSLGLPDLALDRLPALERWRRLAVTNTARRSPLEVAAAHELSGLKLALAGDQAGADAAFAAALGSADARAAS